MAKDKPPKKSQTARPFSGDKDAQAQDQPNGNNNNNQASRPPVVDDDDDGEDAPSQRATVPPPPAPTFFADVSGTPVTNIEKKKPGTSNRAARRENVLRDRKRARLLAKLGFDGDSMLPHPEVDKELKEWDDKRKRQAEKRRAKVKAGEEKRLRAAEMRAKRKKEKIAARKEAAAKRAAAGQK